MVKVVVVGGGMAGLLAAQELDATLVTERDQFVFLPRLTELIDGEVVGVVKEIKKFHPRTVFGRVTQVDVEEQRVLLGSRSIPYDVLVLATGASAAAPIAGVKTYAQFFYSLQDVDAVRKHLPLEEIVVVGGGPTGVELACVLARHGKVTLLHSRDVLLPTFPHSAQRYALKQLMRAGVSVMFGARVERVTSRAVIADKQYPFELLVWTAGVRPNVVPGVPSDKRGVVVDECLRVVDTSNVFAIGDCVASGSPLSAQAALQEARHTVKNVRRLLRRKSLRPFVYREKGLMVELGKKAWVKAGPFVLKGRVAAWMRKTYYWWVSRQY